MLLELVQINSGQNTKKKKKINKPKQADFGRELILGGNVWLGGRLTFFCVVGWDIIFCSFALKASAVLQEVQKD